MEARSADRAQHQKIYKQVSYILSMEIATTKLSSRGQIVIPSEMRAGFKEGDEFVIIRKGDDLIIRKEEKAKKLLADIEFDWSDVKFLADEKLLAEARLSPEDEEAWKDL